VNALESSAQVNFDFIYSLCLSERQELKGFFYLGGRVPSLGRISVAQDRSLGLRTSLVNGICSDFVDLFATVWFVFAKSLCFCIQVFFGSGHNF